MSDYTVINDVSNTLLKLLKAGMNNLVAPDHITMNSPADIAKDNDPQLSLYLFQVVENSHLKNQAKTPVNSSGLQYPALPLHLYYLVTSYALTCETEQQIAGRVIQVFHDNSIIRGSLLYGSLSGTLEELTVALHHLRIEDLHNLWNMFGDKAYKLSLIYRVSTALIDSTREIDADRVINRRLNYNVSQ